MDPWSHDQCWLLITQGEGLYTAHVQASVEVDDQLSTMTYM